MAVVMALLVGLRACLRYRQAALLLVVLCPPVAWWAWWALMAGVVCRVFPWHGRPAIGMAGPPLVGAALLMLARCMMYHADRRGVPRCVMAVVMALCCWRAHASVIGRRPDPFGRPVVSVGTGRCRGLAWMADSGVVVRRLLLLLSAWWCRPDGGHVTHVCSPRGTFTRGEA